jgi:hypothetical protein
LPTRLSGGVGIAEERHTNTLRQAQAENGTQCDSPKLFKGTVAGGACLIGGVGVIQQRHTNTQRQKTHKGIAPLIGSKRITIYSCLVIGEQLWQKQTTDAVVCQKDLQRQQHS